MMVHLEQFILVKYHINNYVSCDGLFDYLSDAFVDNSDTGLTMNSNGDHHLIDLIWIWCYESNKVDDMRQTLKS